MNQAALSVMRFSIVIPARNGERYLTMAIASALKQTRSADEIVVVDDASTDKTAEILKSFEWRGYIKYYHNEQSTGFVDAWNRAIAKATSDLVTILHQDDLLHPDYLAYIENALERYPHIRHIYSACNYIDENGDVIRTTPEPHSVEPVLYSGKDYAKNYLNGAITSKHIHRCPGVTTSRRLLLNDCTYRKEAGLIADDDFFLRVGKFTDVVGISRPLASFRIHPFSTTNRVDSLSLRLAEDYLFQTRSYRENNGILDSDDILKLNRQAVKFANLLLFQAILYKRPDLKEKAFEIREQLDVLLPFLVEENLPKWAKLMWLLAYRLPTKDRTADLYVKCLYTLIRIRDAVYKNNSCKKVNAMSTKT
jgi:glycosyltransferase involved in cell wall biosynthesis